MNVEALKKQLILDEGLRLKPYKCTAGKTSIGVGRNLDDRGISQDEAAFLLDNDIKAVEADLNRVLPWWKQMDDARQNVLANMCFNLGIARLVNFKNALEAMKRGDYEAAADHMKDSAWFKQVGARAERLVEVMRGSTV